MRNPQAAFVYRWTIGTLGGLIMVIGLVLVPLPGPGWLIVFFGIAIVASEFRWARGLLMWGRALLRRWTAWLARSHWSVSALVGAATAAFVACIVWLSLLIIGLPEWVPHWQFFEWLRLR